MEGKSSAQESSESNDDEDTKDEGDKDEDDELETQLESRTLSLYLTFQQSRLRETRSYLTKSKEKLPKTKMAAKFNQFQIRAQLQNAIINFMKLKLQDKQKHVKNETK